MVLSRTLTEMKVVEHTYDRVAVTFGGPLRRTLGGILALSGIVVCGNLIRGGSRDTLSKRSCQGAVALLLTAAGLWTGVVKRWEFDRKSQSLTYSYRPIYSTTFKKTETVINFKDISSIGIHDTGPRGNVETVSIEVCLHNQKTVPMDWGRATRLCFLPIPYMAKRERTRARQLRVLFEVFASHQPTPRQRRLLEGLFEAMDKDHSKSLDRAELEDKLGVEDKSITDDLFELFDINCDSTLSPSEFEALVIYLWRRSNPKQLSMEEYVFKKVVLNSMQMGLG